MKGAADPADEAVLASRLRAAGCVFPEDEAAVLIETAGSRDDLERMTAARVAGEPLEYVVGFADFCGVRVQIDPGVFIPRQRTAWLVHLAAELAPPDSLCFDLCCGSGALGLAFKNLVPDAVVHAADVDPVAVRCAGRNVPRVHKSDLFASIPRDLAGRIDIVLANVPYVPTAELETMPSEARDSEPVSTHDGGGDGLDILRSVLADIPTWIKAGGHILTEISEHQQAAATAAFEAAAIGVRFEYSHEYESTVAIGTVDS